MKHNHVHAIKKTAIEVVLPAGTVVTVNGIPVYLTQNAVVATDANNVPLMFKDNDECCGQGRCGCSEENTDHTS